MSQHTALLSPLPIWSLLAREILRFVRQRNRVIGALATPLLFWLFLGSGFGSSFRPPGLEGAGEMDYLSYFFPGTLLLVVLFTAIFSSISIIEDRNEGFLQGVLVAPVSRLSIVLGKVLGGAILGGGQGILLLLLGPFVGISYSPLEFLAASGVMFLTALSLSSLGFFWAWRTDSVQGFHAVMNLLLFPMWMLSGAFFPISGATGWLQWVMQANPLTYGLGALRRILYPPEIAAGLGDPSITVSLSVLGGFTLFMLVSAAWTARKSG